MALGSQNVRAVCPKDKLECKFFFSSPVVGHVFSIKNCKVRVSSIDGQGLIQL